MDRSDFNEFLRYYNELDRMIKHYVKYHFKDVGVSKWSICDGYTPELLVKIIYNNYKEKMEFISVDKLFLWCEENGII